MSDKTALGDRMKRYERTFKTTLPKRTYTILRLDGRAFHAYLRDAQKPFDYGFIAAMSEVTKELCKEVSGTAFAYHQSDEISLLVTDFGAHETEPWFGGVVAKMLSVSASLATAVMNEQRPGKRALFDARVFCLSDPYEVVNYFIWRQRDAMRNSISMLAQHYFSHRELQGVSSNQMQEMLYQEHAVNWAGLTEVAKRGAVVSKHSGDIVVEYVHGRTGVPVEALSMRTWWEATAAPDFHAVPDNWLVAQIPDLPQLDRLTVVK